MTFSISPPHNKPITLLQLTDSHLLEDPVKKFAGISPMQTLQAVLADVRAKHLNDLDGVLSTGDIAQESSEKTYMQYLSAIETLNKPHFLIRGNHDENVYFPHAQSLQHKDEPTVITVGNWCLILLNSQVDHHVYGEISAPQLEKLDQLLTQYKNSYVLIALHHHTFPMGSRWLDKHILKNSDAFLKCLAPHQNIRVVICGHVHQESAYIHEGISFLSTPSTCLQFKPKSDDFALEERNPGYRILNLYQDGNFSSEVYYLTESIGNIDHSMNKY